MRKIKVLSGKESEFLMLRMKYHEIYEHMVEQHFYSQSKKLIKTYHPERIGSPSGCVLSVNKEQYEALRQLEECIDWRETNR